MAVSNRSSLDISLFEKRLDTAIHCGMLCTNMLCIADKSLQISKNQHPIHEHSRHEHPKSIGFFCDILASTSKALEAPSCDAGAWYVAILMLMDGDAEQPGKL